MALRGQHLCVALLLGHLHIIQMHLGNTHEREVEERLFSTLRSLYGNDISALNQHGAVEGNRLKVGYAGATNRPLGQPLSIHIDHNVSACSQPQRQLTVAFNLSTAQVERAAHVKVAFFSRLPDRASLSVNSLSNERAIMTFVPVSVIVIVTIPVLWVGVGNGIGTTVPLSGTQDVLRIGRHVETSVGIASAPVLVNMIGQHILRPVGLDECLLFVGEHIGLRRVPSVSRGKDLRAVDVPFSRTVVVSARQIDGARSQPLVGGGEGSHDVDIAKLVGLLHPAGCIERRMQGFPSTGVVARFEPLLTIAFFGCTYYLVVVSIFL